MSENEPKAMTPARKSQKCRCSLFHWLSAIGYSIQRRLTVRGSAIMRFAPGISLTPYFADC